MTRQELIAAVTKRYLHLTAKDTEIVVKLIIEAMIDAISTGDGVEIRGFGTFSLNHLPARLGRNPKTGESLNIPATCRVYFKPGKELRERVAR